MISNTLHVGNKNEVTDVASRYPYQPPIMKPDVVLDYTVVTTVILFTSL